MRILGFANNLKQYIVCSNHKEKKYDLRTFGLHKFLVASLGFWLLA